MINYESASEPHHPRRDVPKIKRGQRSTRLSAPEQLVGSFLLLILIGAVGLMVLPGLYTSERLSWSDAFFIATSAVCVTGLTTVDTGTFYTIWGQAFILLMIQLGGLGMLTLATFIISALGGRPSLRAELVIAGTPESLPHFPTRRLVVDILKFTLVCESMGAVVLFLLWAPKLGWQAAIWPALFHSVSAFCNAGFSTHSDSLMSFAESSPTLAVISLLIVIGGLGFITLEELFRYFVKRDPHIRRISVHTKLVLSAAAILILLPIACFAIFEWNGALARLSVLDKLANACFMSITPRTAGFHTIDYGQASESTNLLTMLLMTIGGAPGSTAGGMKTTTFMLLVLLAIHKLRGRSFVTFAGRSIPEKTVNHATGLFVIMMAFSMFGVFALQIVDEPLGKDHQLFHRAFEVISAVNTVGLSMGVTSELHVPAKLILMVIMFVGRLGPIALFAAIESRFADRCEFRMATEDVIIG
jgi:trk system potassium uptake protein TrkH